MIDYKKCKQISLFLHEGDEIGSIIGPHLSTAVQKYDKKFIFRNKRLVINFNQSLTPESTYELLDSIL